jgi:hypothetical protein
MSCFFHLLSARLDQLRSEYFAQLFTGAGLAFPNHQHPPALRNQRFNIPGVAFSRALSLFRPKFRSGPGQRTPPLAVVRVPETPMD